MAFSETLQADISEDLAVQDFRSQISTYLLAFDAGLSDLTIGDIALTNFEFPDSPV